jgi:hypothetical protein
MMNKGWMVDVDKEPLRDIDRWWLVMAKGFQRQWWTMTINGHQ